MSQTPESDDRPAAGLELAEADQHAAQQPEEKPARIHVSPGSMPSREQRALDRADRPHQPVDAGSRRCRAGSCEPFLSASGSRGGPPQERRNRHRQRAPRPRTATSTSERRAHASFRPLRAEFRWRKSRGQMKSSGQRRSRGGELDLLAGVAAAFGGCSRASPRSSPCASASARSRARATGEVGIERRKPLAAPSAVGPRDQVPGRPATGRARRCAASSSRSAA